MDPTGLIPGVYSAKILVASTTTSNKSVTVPVSLNVTAGKPTVNSIWPSGALVNTPGNVIITITGTNWSPSMASRLLWSVIRRHLNSVPGVLQINATVGVKAGAAVPGLVSVGTAPSQAKVTMAVK